MLYAKFQNDWTTGQCLMDKRDFARFDRRDEFWWDILHILYKLSGVLCNIHRQKWRNKDAQSINIGYPSETHLKFKFCEISVVHNNRFICPIVSKFCTEHDSITAVLCAKFQNNWISYTWNIGKRDFTRFGFKSLGWISYAAQFPRFWSTPTYHGVFTQGVLTVQIND